MLKYLYVIGKHHIQIYPLIKQKLVLSSMEKNFLRAFLF